jgi:predicted HicB family RNase H-like nuclease
MENKCVRITLRIPSDLHAQAVELAQGQDRSLNWQIVQWMRMGATQLIAENAQRINQRRGER